MVSTYGIFYSIAGISGIFYIYFFCKKKNLNFEFYFNIALFATLISLITSRLFGYFWFKIISKENINTFSFINSTGFFYGGFIGGLLFLAIFSSLKKISLFEIIDLFSPPLSLAQAIGRIGCFYAGCCWGRSIKIFGLYLNSFPTQILESIFCFILFLFLNKKLNKKLYNGQIFFCYIFIYSVFRFILEFLRGDNRGIDIAGFKISQIIALFLFIFAISKNVYLKKENLNTSDQQ